MSRFLKSVFFLVSAALLAAASPARAEFDHSPFNAILQQHVSEGKVDYPKLQQNRQALDRYIESLAGVSQADFTSWNDAEKIAYWINAYNAITLKVILDHYPIKRSGSLLARAFPANSIRQIPGQWDKIRHPVIGKPMTLNEIEHETLRKLFKEPRIHMALVCAAKGCPPLRSEAYDPARLDEQLDDQARTYLANREAGLAIDRKKKTVALSSIFSWFAEDFVKAYGGEPEPKSQGDKKRAVLAFASRYVPAEDKGFLLSGDYKVSFLNYDWSLNEK